MLMLAAVRIGAIHVAIFAGFGAAAFADRVVRTGARAIFAADITYRKGKDVSLTEIVDACLDGGRGPGRREGRHCCAARAPTSP